MPRDFFDPTPNKQNVILIDSATIHEAERLTEILRCLQSQGRTDPRSITFSTALPVPIRR
jgi:hypothetical protein